MRFSARKLPGPAALVLLAAAVALFASPERAAASHENFRFKWPYVPGVSHPTTRHPFENGHGDAWDMVIGNGAVVSSSEGTVTFVTSQYDPNTCDAEDGGGFGNFVQVSTNAPQGKKTVTYAHLSSASAGQGNRVLQGDRLGVQGKTGHTRGVEPPNNCGTHLHFQFNPGHPAVIDGQSVTNGSNVGESTNSAAGSYSLPGAAIRSRYYGQGAVLSSWAAVGWTADTTGTKLGCAPGVYCRLQVHAMPDAVAGHWGAEQTFRDHPDASGVQDSSIQVGRWTVNNAYWVKPPYYFWQRLTSPPIGLAIIDQIGQLPPLCDAALTCTGYQRFHQGYIWTSTAFGVTAHYCPDIAPYPRVDFAVTTMDMAAVVSRFGLTDNAWVYASWPGAWYDLDGNGSVSIGDLALVIGGFGTVCYPGG